MTSVIAFEDFANEYYGGDRDEAARCILEGVCSLREAERSMQRYPDLMCRFTMRGIEFGKPELTGAIQHIRRNQADFEIPEKEEGQHDFREQRTV